MDIKELYKRAYINKVAYDPVGASWGAADLSNDQLYGGNNPFNTGYAGDLGMVAGAGGFNTLKYSRYGLPMVRAGQMGTGAFLKGAAGAFGRGVVGGASLPVTLGLWGAGVIKGHYQGRQKAKAIENAKTPEERQRLIQEWARYNDQYRREIDRDYTFSWDKGWGNLMVPLNLLSTGLFSVSDAFVQKKLYEDATGDTQEARVNKFNELNRIRQSDPDPGRRYWAQQQYDSFMNHKPMSLEKENNITLNQNYLSAGYRARKTGQKNIFGDLTMSEARDYQKMKNNTPGYKNMTVDEYKSGNLSAETQNDVAVAKADEL